MPHLALPPALGLVCCLGFVPGPAAAAPELVLTDPGYGGINAAGLDQPRLYFLLGDPLAGGALRTWFNPASEEIEPVLMTAFIDTGASGHVLSHLHATGLHEQPNLAIGPADLLGPFTEIGVGGFETGDVSRPFTLLVRNGAPGAAEVIETADFVPYGDHRLWVRRAEGVGEVIDYSAQVGFPPGTFVTASPLNLVGMPVIRQRRLTMDLTPLIELMPGETALLAPGAPEPATQATVALELRDFVGSTPPPGEVFPSHSANPVVPGMTLTHGGRTTTGTWLLDTGAQSSFASFAAAQAIGLIPEGYVTLEDFLADFTGPTAEIGGIGALRTVPLLTLDRLSVRTREGVDLVWENVLLLVADIAGLEGVFGMNLLTPAVTLDPDDPFGSLLDISPGAFTHFVIDTTDTAPGGPSLRLATPLTAGTWLGWLAENFTAAERAQPDFAATAAAPAGDADADGMPNLLERALGRDPRHAEAAAAVIAALIDVVPPGGGLPERRLTLSVTRAQPAPADVVLRAEVSTDLVTWSAAETAIVALPPIINGATETLRWQATTSTGATPRLYGRVVAEFAP